MNDIAKFIITWNLLPILLITPSIVMAYLSSRTKVNRNQNRAKAVET